jgi:hypothetical protein
MPRSRFGKRREAPVAVVVQLPERIFGSFAEKRAAASFIEGERAWIDVAKDDLLASDKTSGHLTTGNARFYKQELREFLETVPRREM